MPANPQSKPVKKARWRYLGESALVLIAYGLYLVGRQRVFGIALITLGVAAGIFYFATRKKIV